MADIKNITDEILREAGADAESLIAEAKEKAAAAEKEAAEQIRAEADLAAEKAEGDAVDYGKRVESQIALRRRQAILAAKQEIIDHVISAAEEKLRGLGDADYFSLLEKLIEKNARAAEGTLLLSEADMKRLPADFAGRAAAAAEKAGGKLTISEEAAPIDSGILLRYGGIDENCTLKALFSGKRDLLQDIVCRTLW